MNGDQRDALQAVREAYIAQLPDKLAALREASSGEGPGPAIQLFHLAHRLAGSAAIHKLDAVSAAARALESVAAPAREGERPLTRVEHDAIGAHLEALARAIGEDVAPVLPLRVLMVDDDQDVLDYFGVYFRAAGFEVTEVLGGAAALAALDSDPPDVVVSDVNMPEMNGYELCRLVREGGNDVPFVFLSVARSSADRMVGLWAGADEYLGKPVDPEDLVARVQQLAERIRDSGGARGDARHTGTLVLVGSLTQLPLPDILQVVGRMEERALRITLEGGSLTGTIDVRGGRIRDARLGDREGREALFPMLIWTRGSFRVERAEMGGESLDGAIEALLLEGLKECDERHARLDTFRAGVPTRS